jgi:hypothetical protein
VEQVSGQGGSRHKALQGRSFKTEAAVIAGEVNTCVTLSYGMLPQFHSGRRGKERQAAMKNGTRAIACFHHDIAAVTDKNLLDQRETDPVAARFGREEWNEHPRQVFRRDASTRVSNPDVRIAAIRSGIDCSAYNDRLFE